MAERLDNAVVTVREELQRLDIGIDENQMVEEIKSDNFTSEEITDMYGISEELQKIWAGINNRAVFKG